MEFAAFWVFLLSVLPNNWITGIHQLFLIPDRLTCVEHWNQTLLYQLNKHMGLILADQIWINKIWCLCPFTIWEYSLVLLQNTSFLLFNANNGLTFSFFPNDIRNCTLKLVSHEAINADERSEFWVSSGFVKDCETFFQWIYVSANSCKRLPSVVTCVAKDLFGSTSIEHY